MRENNNQNTELENNQKNIEELAESKNMGTSKPQFSLTLTQEIVSTIRIEISHIHPVSTSGAEIIKVWILHPHLAFKYYTNITNTDNENNALLNFRS